MAGLVPAIDVLDTRKARRGYPRLAEAPPFFERLCAGMMVSIQTHDLPPFLH
jgi:hypothetical protein